MSESPIASEHYRGYPVRTTLSRVLTNDMDCVIEIPQPVKSRDDLPISPEAIAELRGLIDALQLERRERISLRVRSPWEAKEILDQFINQDRVKLERELGFTFLSVRRSAL